MTWTATEGSHVFRQYAADIIANTTAMDFDTDTVHCALFGNGGTPDRNVTAANSAYNVAQWVTANEKFEAGQWAQGGVALAGKTIGVGTANEVRCDATDPQSGTAADITAAFGDLIYDQSLATPVDDQGFCFNYFGGSNSVVNGTFTVVFAANGIFVVTV